MPPCFVLKRQSMLLLKNKIMCKVFLSWGKKELLNSNGIKLGISNLFYSNLILK